MSASRGFWIAFEGGEGSGKSTQARLLAATLDAVLTREPGGTALGSRLRSLVLDPATGSIDARAEALLLLADRAQHVAEVVLPALSSGRHVVSDRSALSFLAYQGFGRGLDLDALRRLSDWATGGLWPDLVVLVEVPADEARRRRAGEPPDRMEAAGTPFHDRVRSGFATMAAADPGRWAIVDGTGTTAEVAGRVWSSWEQFLGRVSAR